MTWQSGGRKSLVIIALLSLLGNVVFAMLYIIHVSGHSNIPELEKKYPYLSRRVLGNPRTDITVSFLALRQQLHNEIDPFSDSFAIYFEYLPTGTSIGINEDSEFTAASLLKVPVVMAYYARKERLGLTEDPTVTIKPNELNSDYGDLYKVGAGSSINLNDAVNDAIKDSDNTASLILADQITDDDFKYVYEGLDIPLALKGQSPIITAVQYTSVLKSLYFSSVLNKDDSQHILDLMTETKFHDMLPAGVPKEVTVAHKIGLIDKQIYQDCGIVYVPSRPYVVCMISQSDKQTAKNRMQKLSKMIYTYVSSIEH